ncbi:hypothetical protein Pla8534_14980 [Lignipirellula cremea]|uniref:Uncharacterized protein n=1 Tax=Lignipirellula cremea TaxID=2528010 RepID=A0A518DPE4_9BACT|nr:hypothetical protein Pla8534_14980 [Lignipirellula cremea]
MSFNTDAFFQGFTTYLRNQRSDTVRYACVAASPEHWFQVEAISWLHSNRTAVGIDGGEPSTPDWDVLFEKRKVDIWLQQVAGADEQRGEVVTNFRALPKLRMAGKGDRHDDSETEASGSSRQAAVR